MNPNRRVIVALDFESAAQAARLVAQLGDAASFYKVGLQLLPAEGPDDMKAKASEMQQRPQADWQVSSPEVVQYSLRFGTDPVDLTITDGNGTRRQLQGRAAGL